MTHSSLSILNTKSILRNLMGKPQIWEAGIEAGSLLQLQPDIDSTWHVMTDALSNLTMPQTILPIQLLSSMI